MKKRIVTLVVVCILVLSAAVNVQAKAPMRSADALHAGNGVYTVAWLSDTQHYSEEWPDTYYAMTAFLARERARLNLSYIVHTGDLVHNRNSERQWAVADKAQAAIDNIPNGVCAGNHDAKFDEGVYKNYTKYFGKKRYEDKPWYGASYQDNRGHYDLVDIGKYSFVFVYMSYAPDSSCYKWARSVFKEHGDRIGVLCTHSYFKTNLKRSEDGERFYKEVVEKCPNVYMVLCGHRYNQACEVVKIKDKAGERSVYQMMNNYQAAEEGGSGYIRFLQIDENKHTLRVYSYSPVKDDYIYYDTPESQAEKYPGDPAKEEYILSLPWREK